MRGAASQEMKLDGLVAAHPSLPLNSKAKITNPRNGREIEVTIVSRIDPSLNRIVDLSSSALQALEMKTGEVIILTVSAPPRLPQRPGQDGIVELNEPFVAVRPLEEKPSVIEQPAASEKTAISEPFDRLMNTAGLRDASIDPLELSSEQTGDSASRQEYVADARTDRDSQQPYNITVNTYVNSAGEKEAAKDGSPSSAGAMTNTEFLAWLVTMTMDARDAREAREVRDAREAREVRESRETISAQSRVAPSTEARPQTLPASSPRPVNMNTRTAANQPQVWNDAPKTQAPIPIHSSAPAPIYPSPVQADAMQIIPGLPDINSGKIYRLQVGAYSASNMANWVAELVRSAGFDVEQENAGSIYRVLAVGIIADDVYSATVRLGSLGFGQVWVRE